MFLRNLSHKDIKRAVRSCEKRIREIRKEGSVNSKNYIYIEWVKMTALMMRLERPPIEQTYSLICPTCEEEWNYTNNDTHRFKCCPNCGRWFGKSREVND